MKRGSCVTFRWLTMQKPFSLLFSTSLLGLGLCAPLQALALPLNYSAAMGKIVQKLDYDWNQDGILDRAVIVTGYPSILAVFFGTQKNDSGETIAYQNVAETSQLGFKIDSNPSSPQFISLTQNHEIQVKQTYVEGSDLTDRSLVFSFFPNSDLVPFYLTQFHYQFLASSSQSVGNREQCEYDLVSKDGKRWERTKNAKNRSFIDIEVPITITQNPIPLSDPELKRVSIVTGNKNGLLWTCSPDEWSKF